ncbi:MAG: hypothetical protein ACOYB2_11070 [Limnohabitans sp.]
MDELGPRTALALVPEGIADESKSDRLAAALWLGSRVRRYRTLVEHPLFSQVYGRIVSGESPMRVAAWFQSAVPVDDVFGVGTISFDALSRKLYRFKEALPPGVLLARTYLDEKFGSYEASIDVLSEFDTLIRLQKDRIGAFAQKEKDFPVPLEQMRKEIATLGELLERRRETAIAFGLHPGAYRQPIVIGGTSVQVAVGQVNVGPSVAARRYAEVMQARPDIVAGATELLDALAGVFEEDDGDDAPAAE